MTPLARLTRAQRQAAFDAQGGVCKLCKLAMHPKSFHVDHIVPRELGGTNRPDNLQALHRDCHGQKTPGDVKAIASSKRHLSRHRLPSVTTPVAMRVTVVDCTPAVGQTST